MRFLSIRQNPGINRNHISFNHVCKRFYKNKTELNGQGKFYYTYLDLVLTYRYIFNIVETVEITTNIANGICKDNNDSAEIRKHSRFLILNKKKIVVVPKGVRYGSKEST